MVTAPNPWAETAEDDDVARDTVRERTHVGGAHHEWAMGRGCVPEMEVPLPDDALALECPDKVTKSEWDAFWPVEDLVERQGFGGEDPQGVTGERLSWVRPARRPS